MSNLSKRRVVTGVNEAGKSCIIIDGPIPVLAPISAALAWQTRTWPADNSGTEDVVEPYKVEMLHTPGSNFAICQFAPNSEGRMHATDSIDYLVILSGHVTLVVEDGEAALGPGDFVVDRGVLHAWRNSGSEPCVAAVVNIPAHPVGNGRTM